ncbi:mechanosensitive ion channel family protein [Phyllobacterium salinisoli]|uniref:Mechanosensitive ion channel family protein n=1 Tax=Phyllobacterium salinisoli TaxID=1899321 RepID=A0A368K8F3_9HYPH|nr:mechanosensitive ion channel family protein [Phyllobacterium salinisoli]RCS25629.1 mechanosensitive ion channel family protein [Phyllobacterium salinisoli]
MRMIMIFGRLLRQARRSTFLLLMLSLFGLMFSVSEAQSQATANWTGLWDTKWTGGGAQVEFQQTGTDVTGRYALYNGRIEAKAVGRQLIGRWFEGNRQGEILFVQSPDGSSFMGRFEYATAEWWTGVRVDASQYQGVEVDQSSPMTTMRSFLQAMNESGADGVSRGAGGGMALVSKAASVVDVSEADRGGLNISDYVHELYTVLDKLTFRFWNLPHGQIQGDDATAKLGQFDTNVTFDAAFRRKGDKWFIAGPSLAALKAKHAELSNARGEPVDAVAEPEKLRTPRDTFKTLLSGFINGNDKVADSTLNMLGFNAAVRDDEAQLLGRYLKKVIDRIGYVYWQEIPDDPKSKKPYTFFQHPAGNIVVGPVEVGDADKGGVIWQFTPETLHHIRGLYAAVEDMPVAPEFTAFAADDPYFKARSLARSISPDLLKRAGPADRWQWLMLAILGLLGIVCGFLVNAVISAFSHRTSASVSGPPAPHLRVIGWSIRAIVLGLFLLAALRLLGLPDVVATPVKALAWAGMLIGTVPILWHLIGNMAESYRTRWEIPGYHETLISLLTGVARVAVIITAFLLLAKVFAIPYEHVLAGLGIGGLAVALAAQPTLQNFLSGLTLYADRPVSVGDFCKFDDTFGTVEHIGMRSTRVRSLDRTVISVPNSEFSDMKIENYARRDRIRFKTTLQLRYETTADQLRYVLAQLRQLLIAHPRVVEDPHIRFVGFGEYSLDVEIIAYIRTAEHAEFLAIREDILMHIMKIMDDAGAQFAFPSSVEYAADDTPIDREKQAAAEKTVAAWRAEEKLPFPDFLKAHKEEMNNTLVYPPEGSIQAHETEPDEMNGKGKLPNASQSRWKLFRDKAAKADPKPAG